MRSAEVTWASGKASCAAGRVNEDPVSPCVFLVYHGGGFILGLSCQMITRWLPDTTCVMDVLIHVSSEKGNFFPRSPWQSHLALACFGSLSLSQSLGLGWWGSLVGLNLPRSTQRIVTMWIPANSMAGKYGTLLGKRKEEKCLWGGRPMPCVFPGHPHQVMLFKGL